MAKTNLKIITWKEGKYFVSQCLNVDISSFGKTRAESLKNLREALELYFEDFSPKNLPKIEKPTVSSERLQYA